MNKQNHRLVVKLRAWIACVRRARRNGLREDVYHRHYEELLWAASDCPEFGVQTEQLVRPWTTLQSLRNASDPLLVDLVAKARQLEARLNPRSRAVTILPAVIGFAALAGVIALAVVSLQQNWIDVDGLVRNARIGLYSLQGKLSGFSMRDKWAVLTIALVVGGTVILKNIRSS